MADQVTDPWDEEPVPADNDLYMRVHKSLVENGLPAISVFKNRQDQAQPDRPSGMSTDWERYSTPQDTRQRARSSRPEDNGVISLNVGKVRAVYGQQVRHTPHFRWPEDPNDPNNRAHTDVLGPKSPREASSAQERVQLLRVRTEFQEISTWEIDPPLKDA